MTTTIQKWGNSLAVRIPKGVASGFRSGTIVEVRREGAVLLVTPTKKAKFTLKALVAKIDTKNHHKETDWGAPRGKEVW